MKKQKIIFLALILISEFLLATEIRGGDGPTPFSRIPAPRKISIPLQGSVSSFSVLESTAKLAYMDSSHTLRVYDMNQGLESSIGSFPGELFPEASPDGKSVLSADLRTFKRLVGKGKGQEIRLPSSTQLIFWEKTELYLLKKLERLNSEGWRVSYLVYQQDQNQVEHRSCDFYLEDKVKALKLASGSSFSDLTLYSEKITDSGNELSFYSVNLKSRNGQCQIKSRSNSFDLVKGNVTSVNWFAEREELAVITDHESLNLYLGKSGALSGTSLPAGRSYIPNSYSPIVVNINRQKGIGVYSLLTGRYFTLELSVDRGFLEGNQIWVTSDADQLFISTRERRDKQGGRALHTVSLKGIN